MSGNGGITGIPPFPPNTAPLTNDGSPIKENRWFKHSKVFCWS
jgi:hypothetical protein